MKILVSACLLGLNCRYCGGGALDAEVLKLNEKNCIIPVCPEQLGGLSVPRPPCEIKNGKVMGKDGTDKTDEFGKGAEETLRLAQMLGCTHAVLKERSPSCGSKTIYDGSFTGQKIQGAGITASLLADNGIKVLSEEDKEEIRRLIG